MKRVQVDTYFQLDIIHADKAYLWVLRRNTQRWQGNKMLPVYKRDAIF